MRPLSFSAPNAHRRAAVLLATVAWGFAPDGVRAASGRPHDERSPGREVWYVLLDAEPPPAGAAARRAVVESCGARVVSELRSLPVLVVTADAETCRCLRNHPAVRHVERALPPLAPMNDSVRVRTETEELQESPYDLDGTGVRIMLYDVSAVRATHVDLVGRVTVRDDVHPTLHPTHVAGTIAGDGTSSGGRYRGQAPAATIESYTVDWDGRGIMMYTNLVDIEADLDDAFNLRGVVLANSSMGSNIAQGQHPCEVMGDYGLADALLDGIIRGSLGVPTRIVWAAGNERSDGRCGTSYRTISPPACSKNPIIVGAIHSDDERETWFSSFGPCDDGRLKPDLVAPGCQRSDDLGVTSCSGQADQGYTVRCGTSHASASVSGGLALLLQDFRARYPGQRLPDNATLKAILIHTAEDLGPTGPDYTTGYGSLRVRRAVDLVRSGAFVESNVDEGRVRVFSVTVPPDTSRFRATIAWDDLPGTPGASPDLLQDLDMLALDPSGAQHYPWTLDPADPAAPARRDRADHLNNVEQITVEDPIAGAWSILVIGTRVRSGPQSFSLVGDGARNVYIDFRSEQPHPRSVPPGEPVTLTARIRGVGQDLVPGSPTLFYRYRGPNFERLPLRALGDDLYAGDLPAPRCGDRFEFYLSAVGTVSGPSFDPLDAPGSRHASAVGEYGPTFVDDFEEDLGWSVEVDENLTDGAWERGVPVGGGSRGDPPRDADGSGSCYLTANRPGNSDVDGGFTWLISPPLGSDAVDPHIRCNIWYTNHTSVNPNQDILRVDLSNDDGVTWTEVVRFGPATRSTWRDLSFRVGDYRAPNAQVRIRIEASDVEPVSVVEAGFDALSVTDVLCEGPGESPADFDHDGDVDLRDGSFLQDCFDEQAEGPCFPVDLDRNGWIDLPDLALFALEVTGPR
jgi:hypothetical protein